MNDVDGPLREPLENKFFKRLYGIALNHMETNDSKMVSYHACFVVKGGNILGVGINSKKQNSIVHLHYADFCGAHAETMAILNAKQSNLKGCDVYVCRVRRDGSIANSAPCDWCTSLLSRIGVRRAFFTTDNNSIEMIKIIPVQPKKNELYTYRNLGIL